MLTLMHDGVDRMRPFGSSTVWSLSDLLVLMRKRESESDLAHDHRERHEAILGAGGFGRSGTDGLRIHATWRAGGNVPTSCHGSVRLANAEDDYLARERERREEELAQRRRLSEDQAKARHLKDLALKQRAKREQEKRDEERRLAETHYAEHETFGAF
jgi:hypothetical protein